MSLESKLVFTVNGAIVVALLIVFFGIPSVSGAAVFDGIIKPADDVALAVPIDGPVAALYVKEGDRVKKGKKLLKLDDALQQLEVDRRKAILNDHAELDANKKSLAIMTTLLDATKRLYQTTASVSLDEVQKLELQVQTLLGKVKESEAEKVKQRIEYQIAGEMLVRYTLESPVDGVVTRIDRQKGEWAKAGETIVTIVDKKTCYVEFNIDEHDAHGLKKGDSATIRINGDSGMAVPGVLTYISPVADSASALVRVKVEFENKTETIIPGVMAKIEFR